MLGLLLLLRAAHRRKTDNEKQLTSNFGEKVRTGTDIIISNILKVLKSF